MDLLATGLLGAPKQQVPVRILAVRIVASSSGGELLRQESDIQVSGCTGILTL